MNWLGGLAGLLASSIVVEVVPIKIKPWSWIFRQIGKAINGEVTRQLAEISRKLDAHISEDGKSDAKRARAHILRFADEVLQGKLHSKEHFDEILEDITFYNRYCARHPEFPNDKATLSIAHIERVYRARLEKNDFL